MEAPKPNVGPVLKSVSPTGIKSFSEEYDGGCNRKHWLQKRCGLKTPQTASQQLGEAIHAELETYVLTGNAPAHESAQHLIERPAFPTRGPELLVEWPKNYKLDVQAAGVDVRGKIDLVDPRRVKHISTWDYKTTGSFDWAMDAESLTYDPQGLIYSAAMAHRFPEAETFSFTHGYVLTRGTDSRIVTSDTLSRGQLADAYQEVIVSAVEEMKTSFTAETLDDVKPNWNACDAFGGCSFRGICGSRPIESYGSDEQGEQSVTITNAELDALISARRAELANTTSATPAPVGAVGINPPDAAPPPASVTYKIPDDAYVMPATPEDGLATALRNLELSIWQIYRAVGREPLVFKPTQGGEGTGASETRVK